MQFGQDDQTSAPLLRAWLQKRKEDPLGLSGYSRRLFTLDRNSRLFYYQRSEADKNFVKLIKLEDIKVVVQIEGSQQTVVYGASSTSAAAAQAFASPSSPLSGIVTPPLLLSSGTPASGASTPSGISSAALALASLKTTVSGTSAVASLAAVSASKKMRSVATASVGFKSSAGAVTLEKHGFIVRTQTWDVEAKCSSKEQASEWVRAFSMACLAARAPPAEQAVKQEMASQRAELESLRIMAAAVLPPSAARARSPRGASASRSPSPRLRSEIQSGSPSLALAVATPIPACITFGGSDIAGDVNRGDSVAEDDGETPSVTTSPRRHSVDVGALASSPRSSPRRDLGSPRITFGGMLGRQDAVEAAETESADGHSGSGDRLTASASSVLSRPVAAAPRSVGEPAAALEHRVKVVIVGDSGVGKTALACRYCSGRFNDHLGATVGIDFLVKRIELDGEKLKLSVWDTAGQEKFNPMVAAYYRDAHVVVIAFDCSKRSSFEKCDSWLRQASAHCDGSRTIFLLICTKSDLGSQRQVSTREGRVFATARDMRYAETSAKTGDGVDTSFQDALRGYLDRPNLHALGMQTSSFIVTGVNDAPNKRRCAC